MEPRRLRGNDLVRHVLLSPGMQPVKGYRAATQRSHCKTNSRFATHALCGTLPSINSRQGRNTDIEVGRKAMHDAEYVLPLGGRTSVPRSVKDPIEPNKINIDGTVNVLVAAKELKVKRVVFAASSSAYGETPTLPKVETMQPQPISPYGVTKFVGELYGQTFGRCYGLENVALRYFNIFGPRQDPSSPYSGVLTNFCTAFLDETHPLFFAYPDHLLAFTSSDNPLHANLLACAAPHGSGKGFNVAVWERLSPPVAP